MAAVVDVLLQNPPQVLLAQLIASDCWMKRVECSSTGGQFWLANSSALAASARTGYPFLCLGRLRALALGAEHGPPPT